MTWPRNPATGTASVTTGRTRPTAEPVLTGGSQPEPVAEDDDEHAREPEVRHGRGDDLEADAEAAATRPLRVDHQASAIASSQATASDSVASRGSRRAARRAPARRGCLSEYDVPRSPVASRTELREVLHEQRLVEAVLARAPGRAPRPTPASPGRRGSPRRVAGHEPDREEDERRDRPEHERRHRPDAPRAAGQARGRAPDGRRRSLPSQAS